MSRLRCYRQTTVLLAFLFLLSGVCACTLYSPARDRKSALQPKLVQFHVGLISQKASYVLRLFPSDERRKWDKALGCLFQRFRFIDYQVEDVQYGEEAREATVFVRMTGRPLNALTAENFLWEETWTCSDRSWVLDPTPDLVKDIFGVCSPGPDDSAGADDSKADP